VAHGEDYRRRDEHFVGFGVLGGCKKPFADAAVPHCYGPTRPSVSRRGLMKRKDGQPLVNDLMQLMAATDMLLN
jgi:hypothetical protein